MNMMRKNAERVRPERSPVSLTLVGIVAKIVAKISLKKA